jgi:hypothetical protein
MTRSDRWKYSSNLLWPKRPSAHCKDGNLPRAPSLNELSTDSDMTYLYILLRDWLQVLAYPSNCITPILTIFFHNQANMKRFVSKWGTYVFRLFVLNYSYCPSLHVFLSPGATTTTDYEFKSRYVLLFRHNNSLILLFQWWSYEVTKEFGITEKVKTRAISLDYSTFPGRLSVSLDEFYLSEGVVPGLTVSDNTCSEFIAKGNAFYQLMWANVTFLSFETIRL